MIRNRSLLRTSALALATLFAGPAFAQDAAPREGAQAAVDGITDIVVTAQRRAERLEDVPMSITAVSPETLVKSGVTGLQEIGRIAPGVQVNFAGAFTQPAIRGVTTLTNGAAGENNIAIYIDGFYIPDSLSINTDLVNIADIQILKGPQGTLYGRNATGGAILVNTLAPSDTLTGRGEFGYGRFDERSAKAYLSGPISDGLRFGIAGSVRHSDGYVRLVDPLRVGATIGDAAPNKTQSVRAKLEADLGQTVTATLGFNYGFTSDPRGNLFTPRQYLTAAVPAPPLRAVALDEVSYNYPSQVSARTYEPTLMLAWKSGIGTLTSRTSYGWRKFVINFDFDGSFRDLGFSSSHQESRTFQQSVDYAIDAIDNLDLVIGGLYYEDHFDGDGTFGQFGTISYAANLVPGSGSEARFDTHSYAIYADATYHLTDRLALTAGGRYSHDRKNVDEFIQNLQTGVFSFPRTQREASFEKFTPRASIRYELAPRTNVYASYSVGYRSGSFPPNTVANAAALVAIRPETLKSYEVGFKTAQSRLRAEIAGFIYDYTNYNVSVTAVNPLTGSPTTFVGNAPKATIKGIDAQLTFMPADRTNLTVSGAYIHARYGTFRNAIGTGLNAATGLNVSGQQQDWTGKQMSRAPDFTANASIDHTFDVLDGELLMAANATYSDGYVISNPSLFGPLAPAALRGKQRYRQGKTTIVSAQATWTDPTGHYSIGIWGKNLTNEKYRATYNGTAVYGDYSVAAQPITYGLRIGFNF